jgi:predicted nucleic acid-binding protein
VREALSSGWLKETSFQNMQERSLFEALSVSLGIGESSRIAIAKERAMVFARANSSRILSGRNGHENGGHARQ